MIGAINSASTTSAIHLQQAPVFAKSAKMQMDSGLNQIGGVNPGSGMSLGKEISSESSSGGTSNAPSAIKLGNAPFLKEIRSGAGTYGKTGLMTENKDPGRLLNLSV